MRSGKRSVLAAAGVTWLAASPAAAADADVEAQLRRMNERMQQMEAQLEAQSEELEASKKQVSEQQAVIQDLDADREVSSGLSKFLSETEFSGAVAASYTYNFRKLNESAIGGNGNSTVGGENLGLFGITAPQHSNSNNFQLDQLYFRMRKQPTPESRAGWGATIVLGTSANTQISLDDNTGDQPFLFEAYAAYLADVGSGVRIVAGRYATPVGAESFLVDESWQITRGLLWTLQPVSHTGAFTSGGLGEGISWQIGAANSYGNTMSDSDSEPTFVGSLGYQMDTVGIKLNGVYGGDADDLLSAPQTFGLVGTCNPPAVPCTQPTNYESGAERSEDKLGLLDAVLSWNPSDRLSTWVNFDYWFTNDFGGGGGSDFSDLSIWGIALAGHYAITEATGFALRYEFLGARDFANTDGDLMSLTATLDHHLTDNLLVRAEARWDRARLDDSEDDVFLGDVGGAAGSPPIDYTDFDDGGRNHQVLGLVQLLYQF